MALFGSLGKAVTHFISNPINLVAPGLVQAIPELKLGAGVVKDVIGSARGSSVHAVSEQSPIALEPMQPGQTVYPQYQVSPGGSYLDPYQMQTQPFDPYGGYTPWASSTQYPAYSIPAPVTYQAPSTSDNRSWEDLIAGVSLLL